MHVRNGLVTSDRLTPLGAATIPIYLGFRITSTEQGA